MTPTPAPAPAPAPAPTGRLLRTADGVDLVLTRGFVLPVEEVWAALTESARTALWFGPWEGDGGPGTTARVRLLFEEETPWTELRASLTAPRSRCSRTTTRRRRRTSRI
ncbi:hypothetical protein ACGFMO_35685 [Streptomyces niveus]|uniref:hypothetical protein n=1 Tax=Streptomyces niveus TaxID=193462 RepID=UPI003723967D